MNDDQLGQVLMAARETVDRMRTAVKDKPLDLIARSSVKSIAGLANLVDDLSKALAAERAENKRMRESLRRIAELRIRSAVALMESGDWKKVAGELQAIAEDVSRAKAA